MMGGGPVRGDRFPKLVRLAEEAERGISKKNKKEILGLIDDIAGKSRPFGRGKSMTEGKWELLYTTEKETLFFSQNGLFGSRCTSISQTIDFTSNTINNLINFENGKYFSVIGDLSVEATRPERINFKFRASTLRLSERVCIPLPPVGQGWFDNLYVNDLYRISYDIRGDYLLSRRIG